MKSLLVVCLGLLVPLASGFCANLKLASPFQDHMVLQRQKPVPVWGWADPGATVAVQIGAAQASAKSDATGYWRANLPAMDANATGQTMTVSCANLSVSLKDILIGEVWFCAGQSNMVVWPISAEPGGAELLADLRKDSDYPQIRFINYPANVSDTPLADMDPAVQKAVWTPMSPATVANSMSVPFFFARNLYQSLKVPVGLVEIAVPGTTQTAWASRETLDAVQAPGPHPYSYQDCFNEAEARLAKGPQPFKTWKDFAAANAAWHANPTGRWPGENLSILDYPSALYNALIHPLAPMAMRGMIWHQGEAGPYVDHGKRMVAIVDQWRKLYEQDFDFIFGSMSRKTGEPPPLAPVAESFRGDINEQFLLAQRLFGYDDQALLCGFVDLGNPGTHWGRKDEAGRRMALAALDNAYGRKTVFTGPQLLDGTIEGSTVRCRFTDIGSGLQYQPSIDGISGFILQGKSNGADTSVWVTPAIDGGDTLVFSDPRIQQPVNLLYAWHSNPHETLFNKEGFPAYGFRLNDKPFPQPQSPVQIVTVVSQTDKKSALNVSEVRRYAYVFNFLDPQNGQGTNDVKLYIPREWEKPAISQADKELPLPDMTTDAQGNRFIDLQMQASTPATVIYDSSKPDALKSANTQRF